MVEIGLNLRSITNRNPKSSVQKDLVHYLSRWKMELLRRRLKYLLTDEKG